MPLSVSRANTAGQKNVGVAKANTTGLGPSMARFNAQTTFHRNWSLRPTLCMHPPSIGARRVSPQSSAHIFLSGLVRQSIEHSHSLRFLYGLPWLPATRPGLRLCSSFGIRMYMCFLFSCAAAPVFSSVLCSGSWGLASAFDVAFTIVSCAAHVHCRFKFEFRR